MITSARQYKAAKEKLEMLNAALESAPLDNVPEEVRVAAIGQTRELAQEIEAEIREYDSLRSGNVDEINIRTLDELFSAPIRYRVAKQMTLNEFAKVVHKDWRQIKRYEDSGYQNVTVTTLREILSKLDFNINGRVEVAVVKRSSSRLAPATMVAHGRRRRIQAKSPLEIRTAGISKFAKNKGHKPVRARTTTRTVKKLK